jgi:SAM-dependent methyltransferase
MIRKFYNFINRETHQPTFISLFFNPYFFCRYDLFKNIKILKVKSEIILDIGCGKKPYKNLFSNCKNYIGMDVIQKKISRNVKADVIYNGDHFPLKNKSVDLVVCTQVLEHVKNDDLFMSEIQRVLKNKGLLLLTVPFMWSEHEVPYDFRRFSSFGIKSFLIKNNFKIVKYKKSCLGNKALFQIFIDMVFKKFAIKSSYINCLIFLLFFSWMQLFFFIFNSIFNFKNNELYIDNVILGKKN